jgi:methyltransferase (TIGR00027 family)
VLEGGRIFADPLALPILGADAPEAVRQAESDPTLRALRLFIAVRSRFAEDAARAAVAAGLRQVVVLGAGLDTFAYRAAPENDGLRVFEVDHPATQAWKRRRLIEAEIPVPQNVSFAPVDFERETLADGLAAAGFDPVQPSFFSWLGVVPYLREPAILATLGFIAGLPGVAHVVFDYGNPPASDGAENQRDAAREALAARVASAGEPILTRFETGALHALLTALGFREIEDLALGEIRERYFGRRDEPPDQRGGHLLRATTVG